MKKISLIGGDNRLRILKENLEKSGYTVDTLGLFENDFADIASSETVVLPVPTTKDGKYVFAPLTNKKIPLSFVESQISNCQLILCCNFSFKNSRCVDYNALDSYALLNAVPTAEGAIKLAIENTPFTLWKSKVLVIGFGRVGKILAQRLSALGCKVTVSARKPMDFAMIDALGYCFVDTTKLDDLTLDYDIIFNTVDFEVLKEKSLRETSCRCLIDLSSKGGFNLTLANECGITAVKAPGLPGIIATETAGKILSETILEIINSFN